MPKQPLYTLTPSQIIEVHSEFMIKASQLFRRLQMEGIDISRKLAVITIFRESKYQLNLNAAIQYMEDRMTKEEFFESAIEYSIKQLQRK